METISAHELIKSSPKTSGGKASLTTVTSASPARSTGLVSTVSSPSPRARQHRLSKSCACFTRVRTRTRPRLHGTFKIRVYFLQVINVLYRDFSGGPVVKIPRCNAEDMGLIPGWGAKIPQATGWLSPPKRRPCTAMKTQHSPYKK